MKKFSTVVAASAVFLLAGAGVAGAAPGENELGSLSNAAGSLGDLVAQHRSVNGLRVIDKSETTEWTVDGAKFWTRPGQATTDLESYATWFSATIEPLSAQQGPDADDWSWAEPTCTRRVSAARSRRSRRR